jgi:hypothetical protein
LGNALSASSGISWSVSALYVYCPLSLKNAKLIGVDVPTTVLGPSFFDGFEPPINDTLDGAMAERPLRDRVRKE